MNRGTIFDLKEFAIYDGPGVRQTVFLKGCPLRCNWCHNPEGLSCRPQLMVSAATCVYCGRCEAICGREKCVACGKCVSACPLGLRRIVGTELTSAELAMTIEKNSAYYSSIGGGVTFSGGEPLMQSDFLEEVLELLPSLHRAIETSGFAPPDVFERIVQRLDYVIMDIKIFDSELHREHIGAGNGVILENARQLCRGQTPFVIRIPLIPGVNDNEKNFRQTAGLIAGAPMLQKVELLPYHATAGAKYAMLGMEYSPRFRPEQEPVIPKEIFNEYGIRSEIL